MPFQRVVTLPTWQFLAVDGLELAVRLWFNGPVDT
jgi:hypothetical protein